MPTKLYDAHLHLADPTLLAYATQIDTDWQSIGLGQAVVNGTTPTDWPTVLELGSTKPHVIPAIGLHPWQVNHTPVDWRQHFIHALDHGAAAIGEIGLDKWIAGHDIDRQQEAFRFQLAAATERNLPVSIHCLKAIGPLMETLRQNPLPARGIHLHAYGGPLELIPELLNHHCYFSFNAGQLNPERPEVAQRIRAIPDDRILIETDAPSFLPASEYQAYTLPARADVSTPNHPANLQRGYQAIAEIRGLSPQTLATQVETNFLHYFTANP
ncbi:MAG: TatD family hydrolase [Verrucomicrobiota bacterium]